MHVECRNKLFLFCLPIGYFKRLADDACSLTV